ncbi:MAG: LCP family protein [Clostridia bacterium]|nr:LCP family protein [Clostridia bacterium]
MADKKQRKNQVSLAAQAGVSKKKKKKKKVAAGTVIIRVMVGLLVGLSLAFIGIVAFVVLSSMSSGGNKHEVSLIAYDTTPEAQEKKVSYFLVGIAGEEEGGAMEMLSLLCYDKKQDTLRLLQVPTDTYIGNNGDWTVTRVGNVWENPTPLTWCETCRKQVFEPEQADGKHSVCSTPLTEKTGSAVESLIKVFNDQYSMPVDNYFILQPDTLVKMVDLVGGIDVKLASALKVEGNTYPAGKTILDGKAALYYATKYNYNNTPAKDLERLQRQRQVITALFQRMTAMNEDALQEKVIAPIMAGSTPIRANTDAKAVAKMLAGIHIGKTDSITFVKALSMMIYSMHDVELTNASFYVLPGQVARQGTATYYSVRRQPLVTLLQDKFNPYGLELKDEHLQITELSSGTGTVDVKEQSMAEIAVEQSTATTAAPTTTAAS